LSFRPRSQIHFDEEKLGDGAVEDGTVIWCRKLNQGCFDVAFYDAKTLITLQFTVAAKHDMKPYYIRKLRDALLKKNVSVENVVHVLVGEAEDLYIHKVVTTGTGRDKGTPEFTIMTYRSKPLVKKAGSFTPAYLDDASFISPVEMWILPAAST
jgi:hypothetical protein